MAVRHTSRTRAKDSDRTDTCQLLDSALAEGQLTMEEHRQRVAAATNAATLGQLQDLVTDLQVAKPPVNSPSRGRGWKVKAVAAGVLVAVAAAAGWGLYGANRAPAPEPDAASTKPIAETPIPPAKAEDPVTEPDAVAPIVVDLPRELHTVDGMTGLLDQMRKRFGDTAGIELAITPDEAMLFRPDPTDEQSKLLYRFTGGWGDPTRRPRDDKDVSVDLGAFDVKAVAEALQTAPETLGVAPTDVSEIFVDVDHIAEPPGPGALELLVKVETTSGSDGYIYLDSAGNTKRVEHPR